MKRCLSVAAFVASTLLCLPSFAQAPTQAATPTHAVVPLGIIVVPSAERAKVVLTNLKHGADFASIAKAESSDPSSISGGYLGKLDPSTLRPELRTAARDLRPGQLSAIIRIPSGYAILKVLESTTAARIDTVNHDRLLALSARGSVKLAPDVAGLSEALSSLFASSKPDGWNQNTHLTCSLWQQSVSNTIKTLEVFLDPANTAARQGYSASDLLQAHFGLGNLYSYLGNMGPAAEQFEAAYQIAQSDIPDAIPLMEQTLGITYLHKSEADNDIFRAPGEKCLFPIRPQAACQKNDDTQKAIDHMMNYLALKPGDLETTWLLNRAYMMMGKYPADVPAKYLIPPSRFESEENPGRFVDMAPQAGLNLFSMAGGIIVDDFENNGLFDVVTSTFDACGPMHFFHNNGDGTFTDRAEEAGLSHIIGGLNIIQTDYNNDGCIDILVLRGAWEFPAPMSLLRNNCDGTFTDVTAESGLGKEPIRSQAAVWTDINNDGFLDLFVGAENGPAHLFLNKGDGTFEDISHSAGIDQVAFNKSVVAEDYDGDGYPDFYVSNLGSDNFLYHNNHDNTFTEVAERAGAVGNGQTFVSWFFDYDNDGLPDLFVTSYFVSVEETAKTYLGLPFNATTMKLYKNLGDGTFRDATAETHLDKVFMPMGANFGDIDNDGYLDMYLGTGNPSYESEVPNVLLRNHDGKYFTDVTAATGTGELHKGHAIAFADLRNNGQEDIITVIGGATPGDSHALRLFANPGNDNDWITLKLVGVKSNRQAIGAHIKVTIENEGHGTRSVYRTVSSGASFGASPLEQHIGLGKSARIQSVEITWPTSKTRQTFSNVGKNQFLEIKEFASDYTVLKRQPIQFGGAQANSPANGQRNAGHAESRQ